MKKIFALILVLTTSTAYAQLESTPYDKFSGVKKMTETSTITWRTVPDVQKACDAENDRKGKPRFKFKVDACTSWEITPTGSKCTIITGMNPDYWTLGHEARHCFQGNWH